MIFTINMMESMMENMMESMMVSMRRKKVINMVNLGKIKRLKHIRSASKVKKLSNQSKN